MNLPPFQEEGKLGLGGNYIFKVNNSNTKVRCEICSKLQ